MRALNYGIAVSFMSLAAACTPAPETTRVQEAEKQAAEIEKQECAFALQVKMYSSMRDAPDYIRAANGSEAELMMLVNACRTTWGREAKALAEAPVSNDRMGNSFACSRSRSLFSASYNVPAKADLQGVAAHAKQAVERHCKPDTWQPRS